MVDLVISVDLLILVNFRNLLILLVILVNLVFVKKESYDSCEYGDSVNLKISLI